MKIVQLSLALVCVCVLSARASIVKFETNNEKVEIDFDEFQDLHVDVDDKAVDYADYKDENTDGVIISDLNCPWPPHHEADDCDPDHCKLPYCRCSGDDIPGNIPPVYTPQMIILSFQNAVHVTNMRLYQELFNGRTNPNHCPAVGTFFVSGKYTNFYDVSTLYSEGHEIANNGAVESTLPDYWYKANVTDWCRQISDNKYMLSHYADVPLKDIQGFRTPYLYMGGNAQFQAYKNCGVRYDGTRVALNTEAQYTQMWPYTYDYKSTQSCPIGKCPDASFPGIWQMPLEALVDPRGVPCAELQGCYLHNKTQVYNTLKKGFTDRYYSNRAPMMISISTAFLLQDYKFNGLTEFLDSIRYKYNVFVVTASQALDWVQNPTHSYHGHYPATLGCSRRPSPCRYPKTCNYDKNRKFLPGGTTGIIYVMKACVSRCPGCYPTLGDPTGRYCRT